METEVFRLHCPAYLDGELEPALRLEVERTVARDPVAARFCEAERRFHAFLKRALSAPAAPAGLTERVRRRLDAVGLENPAPAAAARPARRVWVWAAWAAGAVVAAALFAAFLWSRPCRYLGACAEEFGQIARGEAALALRETDPARLAGYVARQSGAPLRALPEWGALHLHPRGAGAARFAGLAGLGAPPAVFVAFTDDQRRTVGLFAHRWPGATPTEGHALYEGQEYWSATRDACSVVCWRSRDGACLYAVAADRALPEVQALAGAARAAVEP